MTDCVVEHPEYYGVMEEIDREGVENEDGEDNEDNNTNEENEITNDKEAAVEEES